MKYLKIQLMLLLNNFTEYFNRAASNTAFQGIGRKCVPSSLEPPVILGILNLFFL